MAPKVSVIIPVYNTAQYLPQCLDSLKNQTLNDIEIICVDNGSTDSSFDILKDYEFKNKNIKVLHHDDGRQGAARNAGLKIAKGRYVGFVDSDDFIDSRMYESMYVKAITHDADMAICGITLYYQNSNQYIEKDPSIFPNKAAVHISENKLFYSNLTLCNKIYKRKFLSENLIVFPDDVYHEDQLYVIQAYLLSNKIAVIKKPFYFYRKQREGQVSTLYTDHLFEIFIIFQELDQFIKKQGFGEKIKNDITEIKIQRLFYFYDYINRKSKKKLFNLMKKEFNRVEEIKNFYILSKTQYENYIIVKKNDYALANLLLRAKLYRDLFLKIFKKLKNI